MNCRIVKTIYRFFELVFSLLLNKVFYCGLTTAICLFFSEINKCASARVCERKCERMEDYSSAHYRDNQ